MTTFIKVHSIKDLDDLLKKCDEGKQISFYLFQDGFRTLDSIHITQMTADEINDMPIKVIYSYISKDMLWHSEYIKK